MPSQSPPSTLLHYYYAFTVVLMGSALAVHPSTSSFLFGPLPSQATQSSLVNGASSEGLTCRGDAGAKLEHLIGECMSQYECFRQSGASIGPCSMHHPLSSCCLIKSTTVRSKPSWREQTSPSTQIKLNSMITTLTTQPQFITTLPEQLSGTIFSKTKQSTVMSDIDSTFYEVITANNRKTTTGKPKTLLPVTEQLSDATSTTAARPNSTKSDKLVDLNSSPALWPQYDPSTNGWFQPVPISSSGNPSIPNIHVEDIFSNHFPGMAPGSISLQQSSTVSSAANHYPTLGPPPVLPSVPSTTASPQDIAHPGRYTCGVRPLRPTGRVVGGRNAAFGEWPWQVLIKESGWLGLFMKPKCGGVLIDDRWVLTAAHCQPGVMGSLIVMLGQNELNGELQQMKPVVKTVRRMIVHRDYNPETFDNDIALLELETPFEMKPHVVPICLPEQDYHLVGEFAHIAGFGKLNYGFLSRITGGQMPSTLQTVKLPIIANAQCQKMFADAGHFKFIRDSFLCAGYPQGGKDSCEGDSGGPLMIEKNGAWTLVGTVSHGIKCAEPNMPGVYMKTFAYLDWIRGIIGRK